MVDSDRRAARRESRTPGTCSYFEGVSVGLVLCYSFRLRTHDVAVVVPAAREASHPRTSKLGLRVEPVPVRW